MQTTKFFAAAKQVDQRSRKAMVAFLANHYRYDTMNSWNRATSYANCVKVDRLGLTRAQVDKAHEVMSVPYWNSDIQYVLDDFTEDTQGRWTIGFNGRMSGYLVLYESHYETTDHKSRCRSCGQLNFKSVVQLTEDPNERVIAQEILKSANSWRSEVYLGQSAIAALPLSDEEKLILINRLRPGLKDGTLDNKCGACGAEGERGRANLTQGIRRLIVNSRGVDQDADFDDWSMSQLRERVNLVRRFDEVCDEMRAAFIDLLDSSEVVEEVVMTPTKVRRLTHASL